MKPLICLLSLGVALVAPATLSAKIVRQVERTFSVQAGGELLAQTQGGDLRVSTADVSEVRVTARQTFRARTEAEADEIAADLKLTLEQQGNKVVAEARYEKKGGWFASTPVAVDFTIVVPREFHLDLKTSGGDIAVGSVKGTVKARTSGGDLEFARIDGNLDGQTSGGDISLEEGTADAKLHTSGGDIAVKRAGGRTVVSTSGGDIKLEAVALLVSATTSGGDVEAHLTQPIAQDTVLSTSGGDVVVSVPKTSGFKLDAGTSGGDVDATGLTITIEKGGVGKSRLAGPVNGGGPTLKLRSSGGDITIRTE